MKYNTTHPIHQQIHRVIQIILVKRMQKNYKPNRLQMINYLDKCWLISNPIGRFSARLIGYMSKFVGLNNLYDFD